MKKQFYKLPENLEEDIKLYEEEVSRFLDGSISPSIFKSGRVPRGIYEQREDGSYMLRVRIAGGTVTSEQMRVLASISRDFGSGQLHVTTRQDMQIHDLKIDNTPQIMKDLLSVGLTSKGGGGNTVRNVTACPYAGICKAEQFDVTPFSYALTEYLIALKGSYNLPRKYKISFSGCGKDCSLARVNDLGFIAESRNGEPGFIVYAGGGMGTKSRTADLMEEWIPAKDIIRVAEGVRRLFDKHGDRKDRHKARLRFVFDRIGMEAFRDELHETISTLDDVPDCITEVEVLDKASCTSSYENKTDAETDIRYIEQRQAGYVAVSLHMPLGFISADDFEKTADVAEKFSDEKGARTTFSQNLILQYVKKENLTELSEYCRQQKLDILTPVALKSFSSCAGASTCRLGLCLARGAASACADALEKSDVNITSLEELDIKLSGCPNSCGQHPIAAIGMFGTAQRNEGHLVPAYRIVVGARNDIEKARFGELIGTVPARALPDFVVDMAKNYEANRNSKFESFVEFFERQDIESFKSIAKKHENIPSYIDAPDYYKDWGQDSDFSLAGRGAGECGTGVFEVITEDIDVAKKALDGLSARPDDNELFDVLLPTVRALLITRGVDSREPREISYAFERHFIDTGLVGEEFRVLISLIRSYLSGVENLLADKKVEVTALLDRVNYLLSVLDSDLVFKVPATDVPEKEEAVSEPIVEETVKENFMDLRGVACPMNFVKAKLKMEMMEIGETLELILDDGRPIENVPGSFRHEGQEVAEMVEIDDDHWRIKIVKKS